MILHNNKIKYHEQVKHVYFYIYHKIYLVQILNLVINYMRYEN
jgi:hypothetical protein